MNEIEKEKIIVRYPPSPTGIIHIGNIRSFLFSYLVKKKSNGDAILRFEDTDKERSKKEYEECILEALNDLGIEYDRGPFRQSDRIEFYEDAIETLLRNGDAFEAEESKDNSGDKIIRFRNPNKKIKFNDLVRGEIEIDTTDFGDFIIARSKTNPLYHLTVVVDDIDMGITYVIRGEDHITSTPRQILLIQALGGIVPKYAHLPLILGDDGKKLSKRHGAITWQEFKKEGYLSEGVINYLALLGWHPKDGNEQEIFSTKELTEIFRIEDVSKSSAKFDYKKLKDINKFWMKQLNYEEYLIKVLDFSSENLKKKFLENPEKTKKIINLVLRERLSNFAELKDLIEDQELDCFFRFPNIEKEKLIFKKGELEESLEFLRQYIEEVSQISEDDWKAEKIKGYIWNWTGEVGRGKVLHPVRMALSGKDKSPDPFTISEIIGKKESLKRLKKQL